MMPTKAKEKSLLTSDSKKGRRYIGICRDQYDSVGLDNDGGQRLNENPAFAAGLRDLIVRYSARIVPPSFDPATGKFTWVVDYGQPISEKIAIKDPLSLAWATDYATDEKFPDDRTGKRVVTGRIWYPSRYMKQDDLERECGGTLAKPKELIDFSKAFPRPTLDGDVPLAAPGQFWLRADVCRYYLFLCHIGAERGLDGVWLSPRGEWDDDWRFLVLDK